jgi:hypothetical protein
LVIERVAAEITAKKVGNTGYVSLAIDDPSEEEHYITPSISVSSSSFQKHNYVWDANPLTGEEWTYDSLNSLIAGFKYDGGQSGVQISEIQLIISYSMPEPSPPAEVDSAEDTAGSEANENEQNDEDNTNAAENPDDEEQEEEQQPAAEADSTNSTDSSANEEGSEPEE